MRLVILKFVLLISTGVMANEPIKPIQKESIFDQLNHSEVLEVTLEFDMEAVTGDIRSDKKHRSVLTFKDKNDQKQIWNTKVKLRGKFRRMKCSGVPPLKIFFDKDDLKTAGLADFNDYKIVNYCHEEDIVAKELILKEYLAYKLYNEITEESFRVQLLKVNYKDTKSRKKERQWAILIEDTAESRARMEAEKLTKDQKILKNNFNLDQVQTMALFQFMIGNTDFSLDFEKNCKAMMKDGKIILIPYDFDFSGLVNAPYATPNGNFGLMSIKERLFLGIPEELNNIKPILKLFYQKKDALFSIIKYNDQINRDTRRELIDYLESFYDTLSVKTLVRSTPEAKAKLSVVPVKK